MTRRTYCVRNWKEYNESLVQRGRVELWFDKSICQKWQQPPPNKGRGRPKKYHNDFIVMALTLKAIYKLTLRMTEGFIESLFRMLGLSQEMADYTTLCRRQKSLKLPDLVKGKKGSEKIILAVDSSGLKVYGEGEWKRRQHGVEKRREWKKFHIAVDLETHEVAAVSLSSPGTQDCQAFDSLVKQVPGDIAEILGDGAYDRFSCYEVAQQRNSHLITPPQQNARTSDERRRNRKKASIAAVRARDEVIKQVRRQGRKKWKESIGYHRRSLAETAVYRVKKLFGTQLSTRCSENQWVEISLRCYALNKVTQLGMPDSLPVEN